MNQHGRERLRTTLTFMNYWMAKRGLEVAVVASLRDMDGRLLRREALERVFRPAAQGVVHGAFRPMSRPRQRSKAV